MFMNSMIWFLLCLWTVMMISNPVTAGPFHKALLQFLFNSSRPDAHNPMERPVTKDGTPLNVTFNAALINVADVDEMKHTITTSWWLSITWKDYHFQWNPANFNQITRIHVPADMLWKPDIHLYYSAAERSQLVEDIDVLIDNNGNVMYIPAMTFTSWCFMELKWFPFDTQTCVLKFGSWSQNAHELNLALCSSDTSHCNESTVDISQLHSSMEWEVLKATIQHFTSKYECCPEEYVDLRISLMMKRRSAYYVFNCMLPCAIFSLMSLLVFAVPSASPTKIGLGVGTLLSLLVLLSMMSKHIPVMHSNDGPSQMEVYFLCVMISCCFSLVSSVLTSTVHCCRMRMPNFVNVVLNMYLARFLFVNGCSRQQIRPISDSQSNLLLEPRHSLTTNRQEELPNPKTLDATGLALHTDLSVMINELRQLNSRTDRTETNDSNNMKWQLAAQVLNRLCLLLLLLFTLIFTLCILCNVR